MSWFDASGADVSLRHGEQRPSPAAVDAFRERGRSALSEATAAHAARRLSEADGDTRFMDQMIKSGTVSDQVAAMTLRVQVRSKFELRGRKEGRKEGRMVHCSYTHDWLGEEDAFYCIF